MAEHNVDKGFKVIAEIGGNHSGDCSLAKRMVDAAADVGAWAVKFQTYEVEELVASNSEYYEAFSEEALSFEQFSELALYCQERKIVFLSTPFGKKSADFLETLDVPAFKIASGDLTYLPFLRHIGAKGRPVLLSTGASSWTEIDRAVQVLVAENCPFTLLHCTSSYPAKDAEINLRVIEELRRRYACSVGFSDHSLGIEIAMAAMAMGAGIIEKHFTVDRSLPGGDNDISILPNELRSLIDAGQRISIAMGNGERQLTGDEIQLQPIMRRSLVAARSMPAGYVLNREDISIVRPGTGIDPSAFEDVIGRPLGTAVGAGDVLQWDSLGDP